MSDNDVQINLLLIFDVKFHLPVFSATYR